MTSYGSSFAAQAGHSTDPAGTIAIIGQPPGTTQPTPSIIQSQAQSMANNREISEENDSHGKTTEGNEQDNENENEHDSEQDDD